MKETDFSSFWVITCLIPRSTPTVSIVEKKGYFHLDTIKVCPNRPGCSGQFWPLWWGSYKLDGASNADENCRFMGSRGFFECEPLLQLWIRARERERDPDSSVPGASPFSSNNLPLTHTKTIPSSIYMGLLPAIYSIQKACRVLYTFVLFVFVESSLQAILIFLHQRGR